MERLLDQFPVVGLSTTAGSEKVRHSADCTVLLCISQDVARAVTGNRHHPRLGEVNRARKSSMLPAGRAGNGRERYRDYGHV